MKSLRRPESVDASSLDRIESSDRVEPIRAESSTGIVFAGHDVIYCNRSFRVHIARRVSINKV